MIFRLAFAFALISSTAFASAPYEVEWIQRLHLDPGGFAQQLELTATGNVAVTNDGYSQSPTLIEFDPLGNETSRSVLSSSAKFATVDLLPNGTSYLAEIFNPSSPPDLMGYSSTVSHLDELGSTTWSYTTPAGESTSISHPTVDSTGNTYYLGHKRYYEGSTLVSYGFVGKLDDQGQSAWQTPQSAVAGSSFGTVPALHPDGGVVIAGQQPGTGDSNNDTKVDYFDSMGNLAWSQSMDLGPMDIPADIAVDELGNTYLAWFTLDHEDPNDMNNWIGFQLSLSKLDDSGNIVWSQQVQSDTLTIAPGIIDSDSFDLAIDAAGNVLLSGQGVDTSSPGYNSDSFVMLFDPEGDKHWEQVAGGPEYEMSTNLLIDDQGNIYLCGYTNSSLDGTANTSEDGFVAKLSAVVPEPTSQAMALLLLAMTGLGCSKFRQNWRQAS